MSKPRLGQAQSTVSQDSRTDCSASLRLRCILSIRVCNESFGNKVLTGSKSTLDSSWAYFPIFLRKRVHISPLPGYVVRKGCNMIRTSAKHFVMRYSSSWSEIRTVSRKCVIRKKPTIQLQMAVHRIWHGLGPFLPDRSAGSKRWLMIFVGVENFGMPETNSPKNSVCDETGPTQ